MHGAALATPPHADMQRLLAVHDPIPMAGLRGRKSPRGDTHTHMPPSPPGLLVPASSGNTAHPACLGPMWLCGCGGDRVFEQRACFSQISFDVSLASSSAACRRPRRVLLPPRMRAWVTVWPLDRTQVANPGPTPTSLSTGASGALSASTTFRLRAKAACIWRRSVRCGCGWSRHCRRCRRRLDDGDQGWGGPVLRRVPFRVNRIVCRWSLRDLNTDKPTRRPWHRSATESRKFVYVRSRSRNADCPASTDTEAKRAPPGCPLRHGNRKQGRNSRRNRRLVRL